MRILRGAAAGWLLVLMVIMWYPAQHLAGFDLTSFAVQGTAFGVGAVLLALSDSANIRVALRVSPPRQEDLVALLLRRLRGRMPRIACALIAYAAILELGKWFAPTRQVRMSSMAEDIGSVLLASFASYTVVSVLLSNHPIRRIAERHLRYSAASLKLEASYAGMLRDTVQAAYAICASRSIPAEAKIEHLQQVLNAALSTDPPIHQETILDAAHGERRKPASAPLRWAARRFRMLHG